MYDHLIENEINYGKGFSIREGIKKSKGDIILIQDDLEYDPRDYNKLLNPIIDNKADVVYGSRFSSSEEKEFYFLAFFWKQIINFIF